MADKRRKRRPSEREPYDPAAHCPHCQYPLNTGRHQPDCPEYQGPVPASWSGEADDEVPADLDAVLGPVPVAQPVSTGQTVTITVGAVTVTITG